ncbi:MAG: hypothetical protein Q7S84_04030 [bacterium]|nr:hypothetical protein [bacterium]
MSTKKFFAVISPFLFFVAAGMSAMILSAGENARLIGGPHWEMGGVALFGIVLGAYGMRRMSEKGGDDGIPMAALVVMIMLCLIVGMVSTAAPLFV